jgi:hypothetical protein
VRIFVFAPFGVHPPRSAGHIAVHAPLQLYAEHGNQVDLVTVGLRNFERRLPLSFQVEVHPGFREHRLVSPVRLAMQALRRTTRLPPIRLSDDLKRWMARPLVAELAQADVVQIESPWAYAFVREHFDGPICFVSHNVECDLHEPALLAHGGTALVDAARQAEGRAWRESELVLVYHRDEERRMRALYGDPTGECRIQPVGADVDALTPATNTERERARNELELPEGCIALFAGSAHAPNLEAVRFLEGLGPIAQQNGVFLLVAGSVTTAPRDFRGGTTTGPLPSLDACFQAADIALNPMFAGSGMNQKVAQFLSRALPVLSTPFGARGFEVGNEYGVIVANREEYGASLVALAADSERRRTLATNARSYAVAQLSWNHIAKDRLTGFERLLTTKV